MSTGRAGSAYHPLKLQGSNDILDPSPTVFSQGGHIIGIESGGQNYGTYMDGQDLILMVVIDSLGLAYLFTDTALLSQDSPAAVRVYDRC